MGGRSTSFDDLNSAPFVAELQQGSEEAFSCLVARLLRPLFNFLAVRMNVPDSRAEEVAADVLMAVHQKIKTFRFDGRGKLTTWIFEIAKNRAIDYHRGSKPEIQKCDASTLLSREHQKVETSEREDAQILWIRNQLSQLSDQDQQILKWRAIDFPFGQIGEWLGINEGTARVRHKRALDKLKQQAKAAPLPGETHHE